MPSPFHKRQPPKATAYGGSVQQGIRSLTIPTTPEQINAISNASERDKTTRRIDSSPAPKEYTAANQAFGDASQIDHQRRMKRQHNLQKVKGFFTGPVRQLFARNPQQSAKYRQTPGGTVPLPTRGRSPPKIEGPSTAGGAQRSGSKAPPVRSFRSPARK